MDIEIADDEIEGWAIVRASGEIDVATAPKLRDRLSALVDDGVHRLVVDLEDVAFIDSTGLGVLVGAVRRARTADGDVRLVSTNPRILKVFQATGLDEVFAISATVDEAVGDQA